MKTLTLSVVTTTIVLSGIYFLIVDPLLTSPQAQAVWQILK